MCSKKNLITSPGPLEDGTRKRRRRRKNSSPQKETTHGKDEDNSCEFPSPSSQPFATHSISVMKVRNLVDPPNTSPFD